MMDRRKKRIRPAKQPDVPVEKNNWWFQRAPGVLEVHFENRDGSRTKVNLSSWLAIGPLCVSLATAFANTQANKQQAGRYSAAGNFKQAALKYFRSQEKRFSTPDEVPANFITQIKQNLDKPDPITNKILSQSTRTNYLKAIVLLVPELIRLDSRWSHIEVPRYAVARTKSSSASKTLDADGMTETLLVAAKDCVRLMKEVWPRLATVRKALSDLKAGKHVPINGPEAQVARVLFDNKGNFPAPMNLGRNAGSWSKEYRTYQAYRRLAYPLGGELTPLYLLLLSHTGWNGQVLNCLELGGIQFVEVLGARRIHLQSVKRRGGSRGRPGTSSIIRWAANTSDNSLSVNNIISFLLEWTMLLRDYAAEPLSRDLFLHAVSEGGRNEVSGLRIDSYAGRLDNIPTRITNYIMVYCQSKGSPYCGASALRMGMAELIDKATNGDAVLLKNLLGHRLIDTGQDHYRTVAMLQRSKENMAGAIATHQRWITSQGKVDTRSKPSNRDSTAATPGFTCLDAFHSPIGGQVEGRLCTAYGMCPSCPLAGSDNDEAYAFARALQLKEEYERARGRLGLGIWRCKFQRPYDALVTRWIPSLDSTENRKQAVLVTLSALPALE